MTKRVFIVLMIGVAAYAGCAGVAPPAASPAAAAAGGGAAAPGAPAVPGAPATTTTANGTTVVAVSPAAPACCPPPTLWQFLGVANLVKHLGADLNQIRNCLGSIFPGLEATPPLTAITDPSNLNSSNPAESAAAAAKADEDQAPQKIKAIRYLATLGCVGCYAGVEDALLASLDDCTESVRYEAVKALRDLSGKPCSVCKTKSCCSPKVRKRLEEVANKMENGCYKESSARVRRLARLAMAGCGGYTPKPGPKEGPTEAPTPAAGKPKTAASKAAEDEPTLADEDKDDSANGDSKTASTATAAAVPNPDDPATQALVAQAVAQVRSVMRSTVNPECGCVQSGPVLTQITIPNRAVPVGPIPRVAATSTNSVATPSIATANAVAANSATPMTAAPKSAASADANSPGVTETVASSFLRAVGVAVTMQKTAPAHKPTTPSQTPTQTASQPAIQTVGTELAEVNGQPVFENEVLPAVDRQLAALGPNVPVDEKMRQRSEAIRRELAHVIDRKLICQESRRTAAGVVTASHTAPGGADEGTTADAWLARVLRVDDHVEPAEIAAFYQTNRFRFMRAGEVRYEEVAAPIGRFPSRDLALAAIRYVRDRVQGIAAQPPAVNMAAIEVSTFNWTRHEEITSPALAAILFQLPIGVPSQPFDTGDALRVVRVLERHNAGPAPLEAMSEVIRQQIVGARRDYLAAAYVAELRGRAEVWTVFDPPAPSPMNFARPEAAEERQ